MTIYLTIQAPFKFKVGADWRLDFIRITSAQRRRFEFGVSLENATAY